MRSFLPSHTPQLGALPLRTACIGSPEQYGMNHYGPGQIWVARASDRTPSGYTVERALADDAEVAALLGSGDRPPSCARLLVVRDQHHQVRACAALVLREDDALLHGLMVVPALRRLGLAKKLLLALEREAVRAGRPLLRLETRPEQSAARALFTRMGFERRGPGGDAAASLMEKLLG